MFEYHGKQSSISPVRVISFIVIAAMLLCLPTSFKDNAYADVGSSDLDSATAISSLPYNDSFTTTSDDTIPLSDEETYKAKLYKVELTAETTYKATLDTSDDSDRGGILLLSSSGAILGGDDYSFEHYYFTGYFNELTFSLYETDVYYIYCTSYNTNMGMDFSFVSEMDYHSISGYIDNFTSVEGISLNVYSIIENETISFYRYISLAEDFEVRLPNGTYLFEFEYEINDVLVSEYKVVIVDDEDHDMGTFDLPDYVETEISVTDDSNNTLTKTYIRSYRIIDINEGGDAFPLYLFDNYRNTGTSNSGIFYLTPGKYAFYTDPDDYKYPGQWHDGKLTAVDAEQVEITSGSLNINITSREKPDSGYGSVLTNTPSTALKIGDNPFSLAGDDVINFSNDNYIYGKVYRMPVTKGSEYIFELKRSGGSVVRPLLSIYDENKKLLEACGDMAGYDPSKATIKFTAPSTGNYYFLCTSRDMGGLSLKATDYVNIKFDSRGGSTISTKKIKRGTAAGSLAAPSKSGYKFGGWYSNGKKVTSVTVITDNTTLTAKWLSKNSKLKKVKISSGAVLSKKFKSSATKYNIDSGKKKVKITAVKSLSGQKIQIKIGKKAKYKTKKSVNVSLKSGQAKTVYIKVTSPAKTTKVYTFKVKRK